MTYVLGSCYHELNPKDGKLIYNYLIGKWKWIIYVMKAYLFYDFSFCICTKAFITTN
jgi:hypothetical protein